MLQADLFARTRAEILPTKMPTALQYLATSVGEVQTRIGLYQPIDGPEFDSSWKHHRSCQDRLEKMFGFLSNFVKQHTSFDRIIPLGIDSDGVGLLKRNFGRMLFACVRS
jgi:hypothetical protein